MDKTVQQIIDCTDEEIVGMIQRGKGDNRHLGILYDRYKNRVYFKCISLLKNKKDAEDLSHDIFVKIFNNLNSFKGNSKFSLWVHSISFNTCITYLTTKKKLRFLSIEDSNEEYVDDVEDFNAKQILELKLNHLEEVMSELKDEERLLLLMKYFDGLNIEKMQQLTGLGASAIKMRLKRARDRLSIIYNKKYNSTEDER